MTAAELSFKAPESWARAWRLLAAIGVITGLVGLLLNPARMWSDWLMVSYYLLGIGLAGVFFVAVQYATGATWSVAFRRVPEAMATTLPVAVVLMAIVLVAGPSLFPWTRTTVEPAAGAFRRLWLNWPLFLVRAAVYAGTWLLLTRAILATSRAQDQTGGMDATRRNIRLSAAFIVVFAITFSLASFDWIMSRDPEWASTMFSVYNFAGLFLSGLAMVIVLAVWLQSTGPLRHVIREDHLHDLGKLLFGFSTFWMYIWFSQYMLVWYANLPEESAYFVARTRHSWLPLFFVNVALNWAIPFLALLRRDVKRQPVTLARVAAVVLVGRWLDLYLMILPPALGETPRFGLIEIGLTLGGVGVLLAALSRGLSRAPLVPIGDPRLLDSLHYHS